MRTVECKPTPEFLEACRNVIGSDTPGDVFTALRDTGTMLEIREEHAKIMRAKQSRTKVRTLAALGTLAIILGGCASFDLGPMASAQVTAQKETTFGTVPNDGFPAYTYGGYAAESHDAD
jgi:hypothetical protein